MKKKNSSKSGFIITRTLLCGLLCVSSISLAIFGLAAKPAGKNNSTDTAGGNRSTSSSQTILALTKPATPTTQSAPSATVPGGPDSPTPPSGTLSPGNPTITYTDGPLITNTTGLLGPPICSAPGLCSDFQLTVDAASVAATQEILIEGTWTPAQNDFDYFIENLSGQVIAAQQST